MIASDAAARRQGPRPSVNEHGREADRHESQVEGVGCHSLRHAYATLVVSGLGQDVESVSRELGHANSAITLRVYSHVWDSVRNSDQLREALSGHFEHGVSVAG